MAVVRAQIDQVRRFRTILLLHQQASQNGKKVRRTMGSHRSDLLSSVSDGYSHHMCKVVHHHAGHGHDAQIRRSHGRSVGKGSDQRKVYELPLKHARDLCLGYHMDRPACATAGLDNTSCE